MKEQKIDVLEEIDYDFYRRRKNGLMLKDSQVKILEKYHILIDQYTNLSSLIFRIEEILNEIEAEDLEIVSSELSELHYYQETNQ